MNIKYSAASDEPEFPSPIISTPTIKLTRVGRQAADKVPIETALAKARKFALEITLSAEPADN